MVFVYVLINFSAGTEFLPAQVFAGLIYVLRQCRFLSRELLLLRSLVVKAMMRHLLLSPVYTPQSSKAQMSDESHKEKQTREFEIMQCSLKLEKEQWGPA